MIHRSFVIFGSAFLLLSVAACAGEQADSVEQPPQSNDDEANIDRHADKLISGGGGGDTGWEGSCVDCKDQCDADYPPLKNPGPNSICKKLCTTTGKCTSSGGFTMQ